MRYDYHYCSHFYFDPTHGNCYPQKPYLKKNYLLKPPIAQGYFLQANKCPVIRGRIKIIGIISLWKPSGIENDPWGIIDTNARWKLTCYWKNGFENDSNN